MMQTAQCRHPHPSWLPPNHRTRQRNTTFFRKWSIAAFYYFAISFVCSSSPNQFDSRTSGPGVCSTSTLAPHLPPVSLMYVDASHATSKRLHIYVAGISTACRIRKCAIEDIAIAHSPIAAAQPEGYRSTGHGRVHVSEAVRKHTPQREPVCRQTPED